MQYKAHIGLFALLLAGIAGYHGFFTYHAMQLEENAVVHATDSEGRVDFNKRQQFLEDALKSKEAIVTVWGKGYTYEECKEKSLTLGLDLRGGGRFIVDVERGQVLQKLSAYGQDQRFREAIRRAEKGYKQDASRAFLDHFYDAYKEMYPNKPLAAVFFQGDEEALAVDADDATVLHFLERRTKEMVKDVCRVLQRRFDPTGTADVNFSISPQGLIEITMPGATSDKEVMGLLQQLGNLSFHKVIHDDTQALAIYQEAMKLRSLNKKQGKKFTELCSPAGNGLWRCAAADTAAVRKLLEDEEFKLLLPNKVGVAIDAKPQADRDNKHFIYFLAQTLGGEGLLGGDAIAKASVEQAKADDLQHRKRVYKQGQVPWDVHLVMTHKGADAFARATRETMGGMLAIVLDKQVYAAPNVDREITGGQCSITGNFNPAEAKALATILVSGKLEVGTKVVSITIEDSSLGKVAQTQGHYASLLGLLLILLFMLGYYGLGGLFANIALLCNITFILGSMAQFKSSITMPGIASLLLTMGMTVDANVLIFERIREELKGSKYLPDAVSKGYSKAWSSILDGNVTTLLTGVILYWMGQGPIKGFATTLIIGILCSLFTAVLLTRLMLDGWTYFFPIASKRSFALLLPVDILHGFKVDFMRFRRVAYLFSMLFIGLGLALLYQQGGPSLGVAFTGGRSYIVAFEVPAKPEVLHQCLVEAFDGQPTEVKLYGANNVVKATTGYRMQEQGKEVDKEVTATLKDGIAKAIGHPFGEQGEKLVASNKVGATVAEDVKQSTQWAILLALLMIFLYIFLRFRRWQYGLAAILALIHDTLAVFAGLGFAAALGVHYEVDQVFIAAILTVIGYSINDTVVVFDRVREHLQLDRKQHVATVANRSINDTMSRTLITSVTTLIAVVVLFVYGGEALRSFSFTLLVGIVAGTYSSIIVATPLSVDMLGSRRQR